MKKSNKGLRLKTGTYTGNGAASQAITGVGFKPKVVMIYRREAADQDLGILTDQDGFYTKFVDMLNWWCEYTVDMIVSLNPDGFTVADGTGLANVFNIAGKGYTYIALG